MWLNSKIAPHRGRRVNGDGGFTMVEIALSLAVVAFALVAIIGILPTGMTVQRDNREDTLINQEGRYWIEALKSGARGLEDLTNYVEHIRIEPTPAGKTELVDIENNTQNDYLTASDIVSLLSVPKYEQVGNVTVTNRITARVKAITGPATDKSPFGSTNQNSFRYQLQTEIVPAFPMPPPLVGEIVAGSTNNPILRFNETMGKNLWDVRLILRWPVIERGNGWFVGNNRKTIRARVSGILLVHTNFSDFIKRDSLSLLVPNQFDVRQP